MPRPVRLPTDPIDIGPYVDPGTTATYTTGTFATVTTTTSNASASGWAPVTFEQWSDGSHSDAYVAELRDTIDTAEANLVALRMEMGATMRAALSDGVTMTHLAEVTGWSRQWCHKVITRWQ